jgi:uncharacterized protein (UPF0335 family)
MKKQTAYKKKLAALVKKLAKLENEIGELRHGVNDLTQEERAHVSDFHGAIVGAQIRANRRIPLTEAQFDAEQVVARREREDAMMGR